MTLKLWAVFTALVVSSAVSQVIPPPGQRCPKARLRVNCRTHVGIFWRVGSSGFKVAPEADKYEALDCPANLHCIAVVCNFGNTTSTVRNTPSHRPIIPLLFKSIGEKATVSIHVSNSANIKVLSGYYLHRANAHRRKKPALIGTLINTENIGAGAKIGIRIEHSANIQLSKSTSLYARDAHFIQPLLTSKGCTKAACIDIDVHNSGNIVGSGENHVSLSNAGMLQQLIQLQCAEAGTQFAQLRESANVRNVQSLTTGKLGQLSGYLASAGARRNNAIISVDIKDCARVTASEKIEIRDGYLFGGAVTVDKEQNSKLFVKVENVANTEAFSGSVTGSVFGQLVHVNGSQKSQVVAYVKNTGTISSSKAINVRAIDKVVSINGDTDETLVQATAESTGNVKGNEIVLSKGTKLLGKIVHVSGKVHRGQYSAFVTKSGNVQSISSIFALSLAGNLVGRFMCLGEHVHSAQVKVIARQAANVLCSGTSNAKIQVDGPLLENCAHWKGVHTRLHAELSVCANSFLPTPNNRNLVQELVANTKSMDRMHLISNFVSQRLTCGLVPVLKVLQF